MTHKIKNANIAVGSLWTLNKTLKMEYMTCTCLIYQSCAAEENF